MKTILYVALSLLLISSLAAQDVNHTGTISGTVIDAETQTPLVGASVQIVDSDKGAAADLDGRFMIRNVPVGAYSLNVRSMGYTPAIETDVVVKSGKNTTVEIELHMSTVEGKEVTVKTGYFQQNTDEPTSSITFSSEEVRRAPGVAGDVNRIVRSLPSVAKVSGESNGLAVRGGSPMENGFYLDNIEVPNINHFAVFGSTGGGLGMIQIDLIRDVDFSAGGFSAAYGDRLSSIMSLSLREGNRDKFAAQLDFGMMGIGSVLEGPLGKGKGSYLISLRRSYIDLLTKISSIGVAPRMTDGQAKIVYDLSPSNRISIIGMGGDDWIDYDKETAGDDGNDMYGITEGSLYAGGINWRSLWNAHGYSNTSLSYRRIRFGGFYKEYKSDREMLNNESVESAIQFRNVNTLRLGGNHKTEFGIEAHYYENDYDYYMADYTNLNGDSTEVEDIDTTIDETTVGAFFSYSATLFGRLTATAGARLDYYDYSERSHVAPRFALSYQLSDRTSFNLATGLYYQQLPFAILMKREEYKNLKDLEAQHYVAGIKHLLTANTQLTIEGYYKQYKNYPIDTDQPNYFLIDEVTYQFSGVPFNNLVSEGKGRSYGVELTVQKKLTEGIYGLASGGWTRSEYKALDGVWRPRMFDNRFVFTCEGGWQPNNKWEFSTRWVIGGGVPFTPIDAAASAAINHTVRDDSRINSERYSAYHSLNIRAERRFNFKSSSLVAYLSFWNVYSHKNVAQVYWNEVEQKEDTMYQWGILPVLGLEYEF
ncbi:MAG: TonB-dependent receptor [Candidatus Zixiibacteriota bacterium]